MISDILDILLAVVSIIALICFFNLCSNVSAIRKFLAEGKSSQDKSIEELRKDLKRTNRVLESIERNTNKQN